MDISISGVLEELTKTPLPAVNFLQQQSKLGHENPVFTSLSDINSSTASSKSVDSVIASVERTKSVEPTEKVLKAISDNSTGEDSLENKDKKSSGGAMKNLISHFMSNTVAGQVVPVIKLSLRLQDYNKFYSCDFLLFLHFRALGFQLSTIFNQVLPLFQLQCTKMSLVQL